MAFAAALYRAGACVGVAGVRVTYVALVLSVAIATAAQAQTAPQRPTPTDESKPDTGQLEEITVSARYVKENLQETPVAITAISGDDLQDRHVENITDLGHAVPNLFVTPGDANEGLVP